MITDLPIELITEILFTCDYRSILRMNCTCKLINNIDLKSLLINKSKRVVAENNKHYIPLSVFLGKHISTAEDMIISWLKYLFNNDIELGYNDIILPDIKGKPICIGFTGCKGLSVTSRGIIINPTYKIFTKFLKFDFWG
jgi:hypothetical protein